MQEQWTARRFVFDLPVERIDIVVSRLRGTAQRIAAAAHGLPDDVLRRRAGQAWSVQEHVGHLHDLEALHLRRLDELAAGAATLSAADMQNRATWDAGHNDRPFAEVFAAFVASRNELLERLARLDAVGLARHGLHPRLQQAMRAIDVAFFSAEHDDHHVARIEALVRSAGVADGRDAANGPNGPDAAAPNAAKTDNESNDSEPSDRSEPGQPDDPFAPEPAFAGPWTGLPVDAPMPLLERRRVIGRQAMISHVTLHRGCQVPSHAHANEQFACVLSGKVRFVLADGERVLTGGDVLHLPPHAPHSAEALETAVVLEVFAPPSEATGIDARPRD